MNQANRFVVIACLLVACLLTANIAFTQRAEDADSLATIYRQQGNNLPDTAKLNLLKNLAFNENEDLNRALQYCDELIKVARKVKNERYLYSGYFIKGTKERLLGNYSEALAAYLQSADAAKNTGDPVHMATSYTAMADIYALINDFNNAKIYYADGIAMSKSLDSSILAPAILNEGEAFRNNKQFDSARLCYEEADKIFDKLNSPLGRAYALGNLGLVYASMGQNNLAVRDINQAILVMEANQANDAICEYLNSMSDIYAGKGDTANALSYAKRSFELAQKYQLKKQMSDGSKTLSMLFEKNKEPGNALEYYKTYIIYRDSLNNIDKQRSVDSLQRVFEVSRQQIKLDEVNRQKQEQKIFLFASLIVLAIIVGLVIVLMRNNRQKQKAYRLLSKEKAVTEEQRDLANKTLLELKRAQAHLVQSEKMASLGQLSAGIAHEIQNPLNFVTNFSELNTELISELQEENRKGNVDAVDDLSTELRNNAEKINYHGRRADAIVKGMLEHTRGGDPEKKPTNINALVDEYFRLAYLSFRAKDKTLTVATHTNFDPGIDEVNIVPQEIARVLLNLVNNAFYAVSARAKDLPGKYEPTVTVSTKMQDNRVLISVKDNGTGIPPQIKEKIFQPFYTTKGPGVGTGLGLYLSYEIVKAHGGEIKVDSEEGVGSEFTVAFPAS